MNIVLSADCFFPARMGGPSQSIYWQAKALTRAGHDVTVVATSAYLPPGVELNTWLTMECGRVIYTRNPHFYLPINHIRHGWQVIRQADVVHVHSLFYPASFIWVLLSKLAKKPVVWSPHGELSPVALRIRPWVKRGLLRMFNRYRSGIHFHATAPAESANVRAWFGPDARLTEIPNSMEFLPQLTPEPSLRPYLLFIGRLHPIKAIDQLVLAVSASRLFRKRNYVLRIAGPVDDNGYALFLREQVKTLNLTEHVEFIGTVSGNLKEQLYANARVTILPSHSENFGNVVIESLAQGTPVIAATGTPWQVLETARAGHWVCNDLDTLRRAIEAYIIMPENEYSNYRKRAADLARQYDSAATVARWEQFYGDVIQRQKTDHSPKLTDNGAIDFHDAIATQFARRYESSSAFRERFRIWTGLLDRYVLPNSRVLDLGCGSGVFSHYIAEKGCSVIGVDGSTAMIALCNQREKHTAVQFVCQSLPFVNPQGYGQQDVILMSSLLEYMDDMAQLLRQANGLLQPGGLLIVSIPNSTSVYRRVEQTVFRLTGRPRYVAYIRNRPHKAAFNQQLSDAGFMVLETVYFSGQDPLSVVLKLMLPRQYVNNLLVVVCRRKMISSPTA